ncbi:hypothetical protein BBJ28_00020771 [Nothophytophthora sp. Chile5]|nr:hypothetical protein BBJ28_00020771 [Nothophytophthora sp. Chile5]
MGCDSGNDNQFWKWILRVKAIMLDVSSLIILLVFKYFRASHGCKAKFLMQFFLEANVLAKLTKVMNKDIATYLQVSRQDLYEVKTGYHALEKELGKRTIRFYEDLNEYSIQPTRTITSIVRILQKLTKRALAFSVLR